MRWACPAEPDVAAEAAADALPAAAGPAPASVTAAPTASAAAAPSCRRADLRRRIRDAAFMDNSDLCRTHGPSMPCRSSRAPALQRWKTGFAVA
jgi:hypothetical protein